MFLLFLDAVWQVTQQFPLSFEFNERFLHRLYTHSYYSEYGKEGGREGAIVCCCIFSPCRYISV